MGIRTPSKSATPPKIRTHSRRRLLSQRSSEELISLHASMPTDPSLGSLQCHHPLTASSAHEIPPGRLLVCRADYLRTCDSRIRSPSLNDPSRAGAWGGASPAQVAPRLLEWQTPPI